MKLNIRRVCEHDAESIVELLNPIINAANFTIMDRQLTVDDQLDFIRTFPDRGVYHAAICDDTQQVVGIQDVMPISLDEPALNHIGAISTFVALDSQRKRIGRALCCETFQAALDNGFEKLQATVRADNPHALSFYKSQGFRIVGTLKKHALVRGQYLDEFLAERILTKA